LEQQKPASHASSNIPTINYVQSNYATSYNNKTSVSLNSSVTAGDFLVVAVSNYVGTVASISDNRGDTFQVAKQQPVNAATAVGQISIYYVLSAAGGATTITAQSTQPSSVTSVSLEAVEYSGVSTTNPLDQTAGGSGVSSTINSGSTGTTTQGNELVVGAGTFTNNSSYTINAGSGFTYRGGNTNGANYNPGVFVEDKNVYATGTYSASFSSNSSLSWQGAVATFRAAAAPTVMQPTLLAPTSTPMPIPTPTTAPGVTATPVPTAMPTVMLSPTAVPAPGDTLLNVTLGLQGIGTAGDSASPNTDGDMNPLHPQRTVTATVFNSQNQQVASQQGTVTYNSSTGYFDGTVDLGQGFATGSYTVKIQTPQYLRGLVPGIQTITSGQTNTLPYLSLIAGDINGDNQINILDYNVLMGCYSDLLPATNCNPTNNALSDLNDDGAVNEFDYNLFLRELTNVGGQ
jgi:hypothetical protein